MLKRLQIIIILLLQGLFSFSQSETDSLNRLLINSTNDTTRAFIMLKLADYYMGSDNAKVTNWIAKADTIATKLNYDPLSARLFFETGKNFYYTSQFQQAIDYFKNALLLCNKLNNKPLQGEINEFLGKIYFRLSQFDKTVTYSMEALKIYQDIKNITGIAACYRMIGIVYANQDKYEMALEYLNKAVNMLGHEKKDIVSRASIYSSISSTYTKMNNQKKALSYFDSVVPVYLQAKDMYNLAIAYGNFGSICATVKDFPKARKYITASIHFAEQAGNHILLINAYTSMADFYIQINQCDSGIILLKKCLELNQKLKLKDRYQYIYGNLYETYEKMGDFKNALKYHKLFKEVSDTLVLGLSKEKLYEVQTQYEVERKNQQIEIQSIQLSKQRILTWSILVIATFLSILAFVLYNRYRLKQKTNKLLQFQNAEIYQQKEEITAQRDEIEAQRDIVVSQKKQIEQIHKELTSSIDYACQIQSTLLPSPAILQELFSEHFIVFKPRNIVSGDFYWAKGIGHQLVFCVSDCTGHGVPGSLMSMLGISFLNEIVRNMETLNADQILNLLRENVVTALQQKGIRGEHKDGMDIALCVLDTDNLKLQFAGAMNPCWIVLNDPHPEKQMVVLEPNLMPVAIHPNMESFMQHELQLNKGDLIYLFSDGYADQTGGEKNKKMQIRQLKELLLANSHYDLTSQKEMLDNYFEQWKGSNDQVDDVTLMGIKI